MIDAAAWRAFCQLGHLGLTNRGLNAADRCTLTCGVDLAMLYRAPKVGLLLEPRPLAGCELRPQGDQVAPGAYSARVSGVNGGSGTAVIAVYEVP